MPDATLYFSFSEISFLSSESDSVNPEVSTDWRMVCAEEVTSESKLTGIPPVSTLRRFLEYMSQMAISRSSESIFMALRTAILFVMASGYPGISVRTGVNAMIENMIAMKRTRPLVAMRMMPLLVKVACHICWCVESMISASL